MRTQRPSNIACLKSLGLTITFAVLGIIGVSGQSLSPEGSWIARFTSDEPSFDLLLHFQSDQEGTWQSLLDVPAQEAVGIEAVSTNISGDTIVVVWDPNTARFYGKQVSDSRIEGVWINREQRSQIILEKSHDGQYRRVQEPVGITPYTELEVSFPGVDENITLAGTLTIPESDGPVPTVLLVTGSGAQNRDEHVFAHRPFLVLADRLTRSGIAVLRYDDRGAGESTGSFPDADLHDLSGDVRGALKFLRGQSHFEPAEIGVIGHSEGALHGLLAADHEQVDFMVMLAPYALEITDILIYQTAMTMRFAGANDLDIHKDTLFMRSVYEVMKSNAFEKPDTASLRNLTTDYFDQSTRISNRYVRKDVFYNSQLAMVQTKWLHSLVNTDAFELLSDTKCPVQALYGSLDMQIDVPRNVVAARKALEIAGVKHEVRQLNGINHMFQPANTGMAEEYTFISTTVDEGVMKLIANWIIETMK